MVQSVGVDGCPGGWVAVQLNDGRFAEAQFHASFANLLTTYPDAVAIAVDIPIGLPESGQRPADRAARGFVGARRSSVFPTPSREVLETPWRAGLGIARQTHSLGQRIFEVEKALGETPKSQRVYEVHPEVSFAAMNNGPLTQPKTSWNGQHLRLRLLQASGIELPNHLPSITLVPPDDLLDAAAAAWSAYRIATGRAITLPRDPPGDRTGRAVAIWY